MLLGGGRRLGDHLLIVESHFWGVVLLVSILCLLWILITPFWINLLYPLCSSLRLALSQPISAILPVPPYVVNQRPASYVSVFLKNTVLTTASVQAICARSTTTPISFIPNTFLSPSSLPIDASLPMYSFIFRRLSDIHIIVSSASESFPPRSVLVDIPTSGACICGVTRDVLWGGLEIVAEVRTVGLARGAELGRVVVTADGVEGAGWGTHFGEVPVR
jgi:hypothetical protein